MENQIVTGSDIWYQMLAYHMLVISRRTVESSFLLLRKALLKQQFNP
jgi:hypothetical protein